MPASFSQRPDLPLRQDLPQRQDLCFGARRELRFHPMESNSGRGQGTVTEIEVRWIVFDPISRKSFRLGWIEHWLLTTLQSAPPAGLTMTQLIEGLQREGGLRITLAHLKRKLNELLQSELIRQWSSSSDDKPDRSGDRIEAPNTKWISWEQINKLWSCRIRGPDPDRWLERLVPWTAWLLSPRAVFFWLLAGLLTAGAIALDFQRLLEHLGWIDLTTARGGVSLSAIFQGALRPETGGLFLLVFLATRIVHELGHALACKKFRVRCPDIGVLFVLGAPCVYCDVSESWCLPRARDRAAIAAAGIYFEWVLATIAAWFWLMTQAGPWNTLALQACLCCSVCTLLINANPFMRFDGYYILSDWLGETNLRQKSNRITSQWLEFLILGAHRKAVGNSHIVSNSQSMSDSQTNFRRTWFFIGFASAGFVYRFFVSFALASVVLWTGESWNLTWFGRIGAVLLLASWWLPPMLRTIFSLGRRANSPPSKARFGLAAAALLVLFFVIPIPQRERASGWIQPIELSGVYARSDARLEGCFVRDGEQVDAEKPLFRFSSPSLELNRLKQEQQVAITQVRLAHARRQRDMYGQDRDLSELTSSLSTAESLQQSAIKACDDLEISAGMQGIFCAQVAPRVSFAADLQTSNASQDTWCDQHQLGRKVEQGTMLGYVCSQESLAVIPLVDRQLGCIVEGTEVRLRFDSQARREVLRLRVESVVPHGKLESLAARLPAALSPTKSPTPQEEFPLTASTASTAPYAAIVRLPKTENYELRPGAGARAVFRVPSKTAFQMTLDWLSLNARLLAD